MPTPKLTITLTTELPGQDDPPVCAVCGRSVDQFTWADDVLAAERVYVATCHGETEEVRLSHAELLAFDDFALGVAFERIRLTDPRS